MLQAKRILGTIPAIGAPLPQTFPAMTDYTDPMATAMTPILSLYWDEAGKTIWYNGLPTIRAKSQYVVAEGLGGMMIWSLDGDGPGDKSLLRAIDESLKSKGVKGPGGP